MCSESVCHKTGMFSLVTSVQNHGDQLSLLCRERPAIIPFPRVCSQQLKESCKNWEVSTLGIKEIKSTGYVHNHNIDVKKFV